MRSSLNGGEADPYAAMLFTETGIVHRHSARQFAQSLRVLDGLLDEVLARLDDIDLNRPERADDPVRELHAVDALDALAALVSHRLTA